MHFKLLYLYAVIVTALLILVSVSYYDKVYRSVPVVSSVPAQVPLTESEKLISGMNMTFDDEFDSFTARLDANGNPTCGADATGTWQTMYPNCTESTAANEEAEWYTTSSIADSDGILTITAAPATSTSASEPLPYTSGVITTQYSFSQTYGYFEIRAQLPAGQGLWPAFWLLPVNQSWPPEIDVMEAFGATNAVNGEGSTTEIHYASHLAPDNQTCGAWYDTGVNVTAGFHTYGVDWEPNDITYYFDGTAYASCPANPTANTPFYMLVNLAVGGAGSWPGQPDSTNVWPAQMKVDYVRAYQKQ